MFTGIIESVGEVISVDNKDSNLRITIKSSISAELKIDQSVAHNGACLTVIQVDEQAHTVEAVSETLNRTSLSSIKTGSNINLERAMPANGRFDGHFVQGHIDQCGKCEAIKEMNGSYKVWINYQPNDESLLVEKGSVCIDGVSLTVVDAEPSRFSVVIIPYTFENTCFKFLKPSHPVNLEFDILGKYVKKSLSGLDVIYR